MKLSRNFVKTLKEVTSDEVSRNAQLLMRAGFINKEMAGVYSLLPFWLRVLNKIKSIVNKEMLALGSQEIIMSTLQPKEVREKTDRWSDEKVDIWFKSNLKNWTEIWFGWSHEEPITEMVRSHIASYKDLPVYVHQFQNKLRNEVRAKSWIMRCREFVMKDMYSYAVSEEDHMQFYNKAIDAYMNVYRALGLGDITYVTSASGWVFTDKFSHEFQTICDAGEDIIYVHKTQNLALNEEIFDDATLAKMWLKKEDFESKKAAEVWNIFTFGTGKCEEMDLYFTDADGVKKPVYLGSYWIWVTRLIWVMAEIFSDEKGLIWPENVAPYSYVIIPIWDAAMTVAESIYQRFLNDWREVVLDDRKGSPWFKFKDADLIGYPYQIVISDKTLAQGEDMVELVTRSTWNKEIISISQILK